MTDINNQLEEIRSGLEQTVEQKYAELEKRYEDLAAKLNTPEMRAQEQEQEDNELTDAFIQAVRSKDFTAYNAKLEERDLVGNSSTGGFMVEPDFQSRLITGVSEKQPYRRLGDVNRTSSDKVIFGTLSDFSASWGTGTSIPVTTPTGEQLSADVKPHNILVKVPEATLEDSEANLAQEFEKLAVKAIAKSEREAMTKTVSNAVSPLIPALTTANQDIESGEPGALGASDSAIIDFLNSMIYAIEDEDAENAVWMLNRKTLGKLAGVYHPNGAPIYDASSNKLLGFEVAGNANMDDISVAASTTYPIVFGNFDEYAIRDNKTMNVRVLTERYADEQKVGYIFSSRIAARVKREDAFVVASVTTA